MKGLPLPNTSLKSFRLFLDQHGILRVQSRIAASEDAYDVKNPILIVYCAHYAKLLVRSAHLRVGHAGLRDTLVQLRERYWILRGRQLVKKVLNKCTTCKRFQSRSFGQDEAPLPRDRVNSTAPFLTCGVDFAGPLFLKTSSSENLSYIAIFSCATTRAVHLELAPDMSADSFVRALRRFVSC